VGLAVPEGDAALAIPHDDERVEAEAATALHHGGAAADLDDPLLQVVLTVAVSVSVSGHVTLLVLSGEPQKSMGERGAGAPGDAALRGSTPPARRMEGAAQNCNPPSRAPSASALMRPW